MTNPDITQKEKRAILENDRLVRKGTYFGVAAADADMEKGGRYAALNKPSVTGADPSVAGYWGARYPAQPPNSPWAKDHYPPEPPLGFSVEDQAPTGEWHEVQKSLSSSARDAAKAPMSSSG